MKIEKIGFYKLTKSLRAIINGEEHMIPAGFVFKVTDVSPQEDGILSSEIGGWRRNDIDCEPVKGRV